MVFSSPFPDVEIPDVSLPEYVLAGAAARGAKPALIDGPSGRTVTYADMAAGTKALASGLALRGFSKGDVFAIHSPNIPEYALAFHGIAAAGGIVTTMNPLYTEEELAFQLEHSKARFMVTVPMFLEVARAAGDKAGVEEIFVFGDADGATPFASLLAPDAAVPEVAISPAEDLVVLPYSSGTTGFPKGVMLTHRNLVANVIQAEVPQDVSEDDVIIGVLPFFHIYGMTVIMNIAVHHGATIVTMPRFDLEQFLTLIQKHKVTRAYIVPPIALALAKHPMVGDFDLSSLQVMMSGAAPLGSELTRECEERVGCTVVQGYGLTETSPVTHCNPDEPSKNRPGSIGLPLPNTECRLVDVTSAKDLGANETGELWIRGPQVMKGYLNNDEATAATIDTDGWIHTGDIGYVDDDGYFFLVDRLKELIKYKGYQVPPAELEAILISHPAVADAAVIPVPDEEAGEVPKAFVVLTSEVSLDDITTYVAERVAPYKKIRQIEQVDEIPKSASGKILRRVLVEQERTKA